MDPNTTGLNAGLRSHLYGTVDLNAPSRAEAWKSKGLAFGQDATCFEDDEKPSWAAEAEKAFGGKIEAAVKSKGESKEAKANAIEELAKAPKEYNPAWEYKEMQDNVYGKEPEMPKMTDDQIAALQDMKQSVERMQDVAPGLRKKILRRVPSEQKGRPSTGCLVTIHYVATLFPDAGIGPFQSSREYVPPLGSTPQDRDTASEQPPGPLSFVIGSGEVIDAWDTAVPTMLAGETAEFVAGPALCYGEGGAPHLGVPANFPIRYEIELLSWEEARKPRAEMGGAERIAEANLLKARGTEKFKRHKFRDAMVFYDQAAHYLSDGFDGDTSVPAGERKRLTMRKIEEGPPPPNCFAEGDEEKEARALLLSCWLNGAQMGIRMESWRDCEKRCTKAIELDRKSSKAWYRRGLAYTKVGEYVDAKYDLRRANELDPKSREIRDAFDECKMAEADARQESKDFYASTKVAQGGFEQSQGAELDSLEKPFVC